VPEENFWTLWCKGRLTEANTPAIRLGATPSGLIDKNCQFSPQLKSTENHLKLLKKSKMKLKYKVSKF